LVYFSILQGKSKADQACTCELILKDSRKLSGTVMQPRHNSVLFASNSMITVRNQHNVRPAMHVHLPAEKLSQLSTEYSRTPESIAKLGWCGQSEISKNARLREPRVLPSDQMPLKSAPHIG
jgi:hypothetical protein